MTTGPALKSLPRLLLLHRHLRLHHHYRQRYASTTTTTAIRAATVQPTSTKHHAILECLAKLAKWGFAKESLVLLAQRGIEDGGVRVGVVLGKGDGLGRVVGVLLDDPLTGEGEWVKKLRGWCSDGDNCRGLLIRHGPTSEITTPANSPVSLLTIPSPLLKPSNIEILLAPIPKGDPTDLVLHAGDVPGARFIQFPVHKSIVYAGEGEAGLQTLLDHNYTSCEENNSRVLRLLSLPGLTPENGKRGEGSVKIVNLPLAEDAVGQLKASAANAITFEREWLRSGFEGVQEWVLDGCKKPGSDSGVRPVVKTLISSIIAESERVVGVEEDRLRRATEERLKNNEYSVVVSGEGLSVTAVADNFESLSGSLRNWSQNAHSELQTSLAVGFNSRAWRRLAWWKLVWTADDVTANSREVVSTWFLPQSKRAFLFLAGRLAGAGFKGDPETTPFQRPTSPEEELAQIRSLDVSPPSSSSSGNVEYLSEEPYPTHLFAKTDQVITTLIPDLQTSANRLLIGSVSFSATSAAASGLLYLSDLPLYSSSSVAALGLVLSMRWLQTRWGREQRRFEQAIKEQGRIAIVESERWVWQRLKDGVVTVEQEGSPSGGRSTKDKDLEKVLEGRAVISRVRKLLEGV
ncbi:hypothetical protein L873DRAFT_1760699 [Choiromyces venosus 120613-1]|uniref:Mmc1 C-terminal domain-containing protein n=1 Tax=Choiromyces venosus 120613-1 TaxID=1336337 RepID=A0A3N4K522_9PEZI|nr:hypothetical protein L873DRAFT_1760699 [Choiromyces venosus 120613-1]